MLRRLIIPNPRNHRVVHFVDTGQPESDVRKALCGFADSPSEIDPASPSTAGSSPTGTLPCEVCIRDLPVNVTDRMDETALPADDEDSPETYGVGLRGEFVRHRIPEAPQIHRYDGREVVVTECGAIAFLVFGTPPERYECCPECPDLDDS